MSLARRGRAARGLSALAVAGAVMAAWPAHADVVPATYEATASVSSNPVTNQQVKVTIAFTNSSAPSSADLLRHFSATFPSGFSGLSSTSSTATADDPAGTQFAVSTSGLTVSLDSSVGILPSSNVAVSVLVTTPAYPGVYPVATSASGNVGDATGTGGASQSGGTTTITVSPAAGTTYCYNSATCDTSYVGSSTNTLARIVTTGSGSDAVTIRLQQPDHQCGTAPNYGQQATYTTQNTTRTVTGYLILSKTQTESAPNQGTPHFGICYEGKHPFTTASGAPSTPSGAVFVGFLADCSVSGNVAPCVLKQKKTSGGALYTEILGDSGDPGWTYGLVGF